MQFGLCISPQAWWLSLVRCRCVKGRRIIMIGDSLTWQMYNSLACLLAPVTAHGFSTTWDKVNTTVTGNYKGREWGEDRHILKQYW